MNFKYYLYYCEDRGGHLKQDRKPDLIKTNERFDLMKLNFFIVKRKSESSF